MAISDSVGMRNADQRINEAETGSVLGGDQPDPLSAIELFAGAGGLALGIAGAGFCHQALIESDHQAVETLNSNLALFGLNDTTKVWKGDARRFNYEPFSDRVDLLSGGPPCQPFSLGGKHHGDQDPRNLFPEAIRAMSRIRPRAVILENVQGLGRGMFKEYLEYIRLYMSMPDIERTAAEGWAEHYRRLRVEKPLSKESLRYLVTVHPVNAVDYGVPQHRERLLLVAWRSDTIIEWKPPSPTYSELSLFRDKWITGEYWERHRIASTSRPAAPPRISTEKVRCRIAECVQGISWRTVRDAICDLPTLAPGETAVGDPNHFANPGARGYHGHSGSDLDQPAKTLKAGSHGVPGGENALQLPGGGIRYLTVRECARLQTFPDQFRFQGAWTVAMRQVANAVPTKLAEVFSRAISSRLRIGQKIVEKS